MCINPNAEQELSSPKVTFNLEVNNIDIEMTKAQVGLDPFRGRGSESDRLSSWGTWVLVRQSGSRQK